MEGLLVQAVVVYQDVVQCKLKELALLSKVALLSNPEHFPECLLLATLCFLALIVHKPPHPVNLVLLHLTADIFQLHLPYSLFQGCSLCSWETLSGIQTYSLYLYWIHYVNSCRMTCSSGCCDGCSSGKQ